MSMEHRFIAILAAVILASSCTTGDQKVAGIDRGGIVVGPITGFGSIIVNGTRYDTNSALVTVNDKPGQVADLEVGHVVTAQVTYSSDGAAPVANTINFENIVTGPISGISIAENQFIVLGQLIHVDSATSFAMGINPPAITSLAIAQAVKISGFIKSDGSIQATRIDRADAGQTMEVIGDVNNIDTTKQLFSIGALVVDYTGLTLIDPLANGDRIKVTGSQMGTAGELLADDISPRQQTLNTEEGDEAEVEGLIAGFFSPTQFMVNEISVSTNSTTEFDGGNISDLSDDIRVEIEGKFDLNGILVATQVQFRRSGDIELSAPIENIDSALNEITMLGIRVKVNSLTSFEDKSPLELKIFGLPDLNPTDFIKIKGYESSEMPGIIIAISLERTESEIPIKAEARGFAENIVFPTLSILGVTIATDSGTGYESADGLPIDATEFFATAQGRLIEANGPLVGEMILAEKIELSN